jgi:drug/metabolite transporter (DMT)-like permease
VKLSGALCGLGAALLFGASAPIAKRLLPQTSPLVLSGLLYLGAGLGLGVIRGLAMLLPGQRATTEPTEAPLRREDLPPLAGIVLIGGLLAPWLMLTGLGRVSGVTGALLLNLEAPFTILLAVLLFREHLGRHAAAASALIVLAAVLLGRPFGDHFGDGLGAVCIGAACLGWGIDNNLSQRLSLKDPRQVVLYKTLGAGTLSLLLAGMLGLRFPPPASLGLSLALGALSYGVSLLLDMRALRLLGAAREAAYFATAPFIGALLALPVLGEQPGLVELGAGVLMIGGVVLLARERHGHVHTHEPIEHEHLHVHDEHHQHSHDGLGDVGAGEPHSRRHRHVPITHDHPHLPDLHHRHRH